MMFNAFVLGTFARIMTRMVVEDVGMRGVEFLVSEIASLARVVHEIDAEDLVGDFACMA